MSFNHLVRVRSALGRAPVGLLGMLVLVAAVELDFDRRHDVEFQTVGTASWAYSGRAARESAAGAQLLFLGDSQVKMALIPQVFERQLGLRSFNLAVHGGGPQSTYLLLRQAIRSGSRPRAIVVDYPLEALNADHVHTHTAEFASMVGLRDCLTLARSAREAGLFASMLLGQALPSYRARYDIRSWMRLALSGGERPSHIKNPSHWRNWNQNAGAQVMPPNPSYAGGTDDPIFAPIFAPDLMPKPENTSYVKKLLELAARHRIAVFWFLPPVCPEAQMRRSRLGLEARHEYFLNLCQLWHPGLVVLDARYSGYPHTVFLDPVHVDRRGAEAISTDVASIMGRYLTDRPPGPRREALPPYRERPFNPDAEDLDESLTALVWPQGSRRR